MKKILKAHQMLGEIFGYKNSSFDDTSIVDMSQTFQDSMKFYEVLEHKLYDFIYPNESVKHKMKENDSFFAGKSTQESRIKCEEDAISSLLVNYKTEEMLGLMAVANELGKSFKDLGYLRVKLEKDLKEDVLKKIYSIRKNIFPLIEKLIRNMVEARLEFDSIKNKKDMDIQILDCKMKVEQNQEIVNSALHAYIIESQKFHADIMMCLSKHLIQYHKDALAALEINHNAMESSFEFLKESEYPLPVALIKIASKYPQNEKDLNKFKNKNGEDLYIEISLEKHSKIELFDALCTIEFKASKPDELSVQPEMKLKVIKDAYEEWYIAVVESCVGIVPKKCVQILENF